MRRWRAGFVAGEFWAERWVIINGDNPLRPQAQRTRNTATGPTLDDSNASAAEAKGKGTTIPALPLEGRLVR